MPDPAVSEKARRRRFTTEYKLHILREVDQCKAPGEVGAILRREGLHSSNLTTWRRQIDQVAREGLAKKKRGPKAKPEDPRVKQLERENARLKRRLQRAEAMLEIQKKASELLGIPLSQLDEDTGQFVDVLAFPQRDPHDFCSKIYPKFTQEPVFSVHDEYA